MHSKKLLILGLLTLTALAGCLSDDGNDGGGDDTAAAECADPVGLQPDARIMETTDDPIVDDIGLAWDFESYNVRTCSLAAIGWSPLSADGVPHKYIGEIDMRGDLDLGTVAVLGSGEDALVYVLDITDRAHPEVLASIPQPNGHITDVKFSDDGQVLYVASQNPTFATGFELPDPTAPNAPVGFTAYDVTDPSMPVYMGTVTDTQVGCHMLDPVQVSDTEDAVFCVSQQIRSYLIDRSNSVIVPLGFVDYLPLVDGVPTPSGIPAVGDPTGFLSSGPHDMTAYHEGGTFGNGTSYMVVSHWDEGVRVLDFTDAPAVTEVGAWTGEGAEHYAGNVHTAMMFDVGEHRYIVASPEYTGTGTVPSLWVLDADDPSDLKLVAEWSHPGNHTSQGLYLTTHQWQVAPTGKDVAPEDVRIYLTYNHAGVWVLDFGAILAGDDQGAILGYNLARTPLDQDNAVPNAVLSTWDVNIVDGYLYASDRATGLWVFHYAGDTLGDTRLRGFS